jgi:hypothetical protein
MLLNIVVKLGIQCAENESSFTGGGTCICVCNKHRPIQAEEFWRNHSTLPQHSTNNTCCETIQDIQISNTECPFLHYIIILHLQF